MIGVYYCLLSDTARKSFWLFILLLTLHSGTSLPLIFGLWQKNNHSNLNVIFIFQNYWLMLSKVRLSVNYDKKVSVNFSYLTLLKWTISFPLLLLFWQLFPPSMQCHWRLNLNLILQWLWMMQGQAHVFVHIIYMDRHSRFLMFQDNVATEMEGYIIMLCQGQDMDNLNVKWFVQFLKL